MKVHGIWELIIPNIKYASFPRSVWISESTKPDSKIEEVYIEVASEGVPMGQSLYFNHPEVRRISKKYVKVSAFLEQQE